MIRCSMYLHEKEQLELSRLLNGTWVVGSNTNYIYVQPYVMEWLVAQYEALKQDHDRKDEVNR